MTAVERQMTFADEIARNRGRSYYVKCHVCGFEGKHRESGSRAVASWNEGAMEGKE